MPTTMEKLGIDQWSVQERLQLREELDASLDEEIIDAGGNETEEEKRFIEQRLAECDADPRPGIPWRDAIAQLRNRS